MDISAACLLAVSLLLAGLSSIGSNPSRQTETAVRKLEAKVNRRMVELDRYVQKALQTPSDEWLDLDRLPSDMVIYRYVDDTLHCAPVP